MTSTINQSFPFISKENPLILASTSPRRKRLLEEVGLPFRSLPSNIEEDQAEGDPLINTCFLAEKKARAVYSGSDNCWILGADTIVVIGETVLGKPIDHDDARSMLNLLSGKAGPPPLKAFFSWAKPRQESGDSPY